MTKSLTRLTTHVLSHRDAAVRSTVDQGHGDVATPSHRGGSVCTMARCILSDSHSCQTGAGSAAVRAIDSTATHCTAGRRAGSWIALS